MHLCLGPTPVGSCPQDDPDQPPPLPSVTPSSLGCLPLSNSTPPLSYVVSVVSTCQVTLGLFRLRGAQAERGPRAFAALAECCAPFEPGQRYQEFVRTLRPEAPPPPPPAFSFQEFVPTPHRWAPRSRVRKEPRHGARCWHHGLRTRGQRTQSLSTRI